MGVVCNDRCLCSDIIIIYLPELFAFSASRFRQTIQAGILYYYRVPLIIEFSQFIYNRAITSRNHRARVTSVGSG